MPRAVQERTSEKPLALLQELSQWYMLRLSMIRTECLRFYGEWLQEHSGSMNEERLLDDAGGIEDLKKLKTYCKRRLRECQGAALEAMRHYRKRCEPFAARLGLNDLHIDLLIFGIARDSHRGLLEMCDRLHFVGRSAEAPDLLAAVLETSMVKISASLMSGSALIDCGLVEVPDYCYDLKEAFRVPRYLVKALTGTKPVDRYILGRTFDQTRPQLATDDFATCKPRLPWSRLSSAGTSMGMY